MFMSLIVCLFLQLHNDTMHGTAGVPVLAQGPTAPDKPEAGRHDPRKVFGRAPRLFSRLVLLNYIKKLFLQKCFLCIFSKFCEGLLFTQLLFFDCQCSATGARFSTSTFLWPCNSLVCLSRYLFFILFYVLSRGSES